MGIIQKKGKDGKYHWYARIIRIDWNGGNKQYLEKAENKTDARQRRDKLAIKYDDREEQAIKGDMMRFRELAETYE